MNSISVSCSPRFYASARVSLCSEAEIESHDVTIKRACEWEESEKERSFKEDLLGNSTCRFEGGVRKRHGRLNERKKKCHLDAGSTPRAHDPRVPAYRDFRYENATSTSEHPPHSPVFHYLLNLCLDYPRSPHMGTTYPMQFFTSL